MQGYWEVIYGQYYLNFKFLDKLSVDTISHKYQLSLIDSRNRIVL